MAGLSIDTVPFYALVVVYALLLLLAGASFIKTMRGLRTGSVEGLMLGSWGKRYSRQNDGAAFWATIAVGMLVAALGLIGLLWGLLIIGSLISAFYGQPTL